MLGLSGCIDLDLAPYSSLTPENFFKSTNDANSAVLSAYSSFTNTTIFNQYAEVVQSQGTDDAEWGYGRNTNNTDKNDFDKFKYTTESNLIYSLWTGYYAAINTCNYAIDNITAMSGSAISDTKRNQLIGEAKFLRAYFYFGLVRYFGGVPLVTKQTTSLTGLKIKRDPAEDVYALIIHDLEFASTNLPAKKEYAAADIGRATKGAALALLAKVYLTKGDWQKVVELTAQVLPLGYSLCSKYADNFDLTKENGQESIFELQYLAGDGNPGSIYSGYFRPPFVTLNGWAGYGDDPVTKNLYDAYEAADQRRNVCIRLYTKAEYPGMSATILYPYYCNKYIDLSSIATRSNSGNNQPVLRYSDVYLMRAEALGRINPSNTEAYEYLNKVRRRAYGFPIDQPASCDIQPGLTPEEFVNTIIKERRLEFAFEGHRWFDLVRTKKLKEAMMAQNPEVGALVLDKHLIFPIPQLEISANELLEQNDAWK